MTTLKRNALGEELDKQAIALLTNWIGQQLNDASLKECKSRADFYQALGNGIRLGLWLHANKPSYGLKVLLHQPLPTPCITPTDIAHARENISHVLTAICNIYHLKTIDLFESNNFVIGVGSKDNILSCLLRLVQHMADAPKELKEFSQVYLGGKEEEVCGQKEKPKSKASNNQEKEWQPTTALDQLVSEQVQRKKDIRVTKEKEDERGISGVYSFQRHKVIVTIIMKRAFVQVGTETLPLSRFLDSLMIK